MKNQTFVLLLALVLITVKSSAFPAYTLPDNIVQNGNFQSYFTDWSGNVPAILARWSTVPNDYAALAKDTYQNLSTIPGQRYELSFYAAADLYLSPDLDLSILLNNQTLDSFVTTPYTYNPQVNRYEQMHWEGYIFTFTASSSTTKLEFADQNSPYFGLAAVSVAPVPDGGNTGWMLMAGLGLVCWCCTKLKPAAPGQG